MIDDYDDDDDYGDGHDYGDGDGDGDYGHIDTFSLPPHGQPPRCSCH